MFSSLGCALTTSKYHKRAPIWSQESWVFYSSCFVEILLACRIHDIIRFKTSTTWTINRNRQKSLLFFLFYFLFSLAFWSRCAVKNYIFFTRRAFTTYGTSQSRKHTKSTLFSSFFFCFYVFLLFLSSLTHSFTCPHLFRFLFGLFWLLFFFFVLLCSFLTWPCLSLVSWPCNPLFSSLGGFFPGLELPPFFFVFFSFSFFCPPFFFSFFPPLFRPSVACLCQPSPLFKLFLLYKIKQWGKRWSNLLLLLLLCFLNHPFNFLYNQSLIVFANAPQLPPFLRFF